MVSNIEVNCNLLLLFPKHHVILYYFHFFHMILMLLLLQQFRSILNDDDIQASKNQLIYIFCVALVEKEMNNTNELNSLFHSLFFSKNRRFSRYFESGFEIENLFLESNRKQKTVYLHSVSSMNLFINQLLDISIRFDTTQCERCDVLI